jgi:basic amino acid/polyamine antiporter, APA family
MADNGISSTEIMGGQFLSGGRVLIRGIGILGATSFGVACISLSTSGLLPFSTFAGMWPGVDIVRVLTIALIFCIFHAYVYAVIGAAVPRSGADYILASRTLSAPLAFMASWTLVIFSALFAGSLIALIPQSTIPTLLQILGTISNNNTMLDLAVTSATPQGVILIGTVCTVLAFFTTMFSIKVVQRILIAGLFLGLFAWGVIYYQLGTVPMGSFPAAWDTFMGAGSYEQRVALAQSLGMVMKTSPVLVTQAGLIMGFWIFYGYYITTFFAGEVKQPAKTLLAGSWISLLLTWAIFVGGTLLLLRLVPAEWISAESYLYQAKYSGLSMPWIIFYAAILRPSFPLVLIVSLGWIYTLINLVQTYFFYTSRILLAWANDKLAPSILGYIHPGFRSPMVAMLVIAIIAQFGLVISVQGGTMGSQLNFVFFVVITQLIPVAAVTLYPFLKPDWFAKAPDLVRAKIGPIPIITLTGTISFFFLLWLVVSYFINPVVNGLIRPTSLIILAVMLISGLIWYWSWGAYNKRNGINVKQTFSTIPED